MVKYNKRMFDTEKLKEVLYDESNELKLILDRYIESTRWSKVNELIFEFEGKLYSTTYSYGATEQQDEMPFQYADDTIECFEVEPVEKIIVDYRYKEYSEDETE